MQIIETTTNHSYGQYGRNSFATLQQQVDNVQSNEIFTMHGRNARDLIRFSQTSDDLPVRL